MSIKIALAGNPNCGKTTLFNNLTGSNQYVGNWPGVTVEKKEGKLKGDKDVIIQDLPGIYSLSPYTLEEVVSRTYLVKEKPDAILNFIDGTNIERNLYLTTQLIELGIPVVMAVNMIDLVRKNGDKIDLKKLSAELGCQAVEISALKGEGTEAAAKAAVAAAKATKAAELPHVFTGSVEHAIAHIEESIQGKVDDRFLLLGEGYLKEGGKISSYSEQRIPINYVNLQYQATHLYIIFKSGTVICGRNDCKCRVRLYMWCLYAYF